MQRDLQQLQRQRFDLLVVGGGVNGAWIALDAALRGLRTALVDKGDFGAATSAATGKMIHGGIRYLQHLALGRLKNSLHERMLLLRNAPHLVHPVPFLIPTSGHLLKGKEILKPAMLVYDFFAGKAVPGPPYADIPSHRMLSRPETLRLEPHLSSNRELTGAALFYDCQMPFPERLTLAVIQTAHQAGAVTANYVQAVDFSQRRKMIRAVRLRDNLSGDELEVEAGCVVNAAGPWAFDLPWANGSGGRGLMHRRFSKGIHLITRALTSGHGLALATRHQHSGSWLDRGGRHFFIVPWRGHSLVGTTNVPFDGDPDQKLVCEQDIQGLIADVNSIYPAAGLCREDVLFFYGGLYPDDPDAKSPGYQGAREDRILDHEKEQGPHNALSVIGVKYTTGRVLARSVVDLVARKLKKSTQPCRTETTVLFGGDMPGLGSYLRQARQRLAPGVEAEETSRLAAMYGTKIFDVLALMPQDGPGPSDQSPERVVQAQVRYAVRREMAVKLTDVLFRRTDLGLLGRPGTETLRTWAAYMAAERGWDQDRAALEIAAVEDCFDVANSS